MSQNGLGGMGGGLWKSGGGVWGLILNLKSGIECLNFGIMNVELELELKNVELELVNVNV